VRELTAAIGKQQDLGEHVALWVGVLPAGHQPAACAVGGIRGRCRIPLHADGVARGKNRTRRA
jgi:hypothetical protein